MIRLGITGGIGSGKTTVANFFKSKGATIFDADKQAKELIKSNIELQHLIIKTFGEKVTINKKLDLTKLANHAFSKKEYQIKLNKIIWPKIFNLILSSANDALLLNKDLFIVDSALIIEANFINFFDSIILITANKATRVKRILKKGLISKTQIEQRICLQMNDEMKKKYADEIIDNNCSIKQLTKRISYLYNKIII